MILVRLLPAFIRRRVEHSPNLVKILDNIGWLFADKILRMGAGLVVGVWVARYLGPQQFGQFNYALAFVGLFASIAALGLNGIVVRDLVNDPQGATVTLGSAFIMQISSGLFALLLMVGTISFIKPEDGATRLMVAVFGIGSMLKATETIKYWFESQIQSRYSVWVENGAFLIVAGVRVFLILLKAPLLAFVWATLAEASLTAVGLLWMYSKQVHSLSRWRVSSARAKSLLKDSWPLILAGMTIAVYMRIDQIMLGQMLGPAAVGIYSGAIRISEIWYFVPMVIVSSVFPSIIEAKKHSGELYYRRLRRLFEIVILIALVFAVPMSFFANQLVVFILGPAFAKAGPVLAAHIWAGVFVAIGVVGGQWYLVEGLQKLQLWRTALGAMMNVGLNLFLIPRFGVLGSAWATVASYAVAAYFSDLLSKKTRIVFFMKTEAILMKSLFGRSRV